MNSVRNVISVVIYMSYLSREMLEFTHYDNAVG
jgi:hypothetical protein